MVWDQATIYSFINPIAPVIVLVLALLLDKYLGEPRRFHPLVGFGKLANNIEKRLYGTASTADYQHH